MKFSVDVNGWPRYLVRNMAENFNRLSTVHERYRQTDDRQTDGRQQIANVNMSSRSLKTLTDLTVMLIKITAENYDNYYLSTTALGDLERLCNLLKVKMKNSSAFHKVGW